MSALTTTGPTSRVPPGERPKADARVWIMLLYSVVAMGGVVVVGVAIASSLFLGRLPASATPFLMILPAATTIVVLLAYGSLRRRVPLERMVVWSNLMLCAGALVFRLLLAGPFGESFALLMTLFLFTDIAATLATLQFWTFAGQLFDPRESRRLMGRIAVGGTLAQLVMGLSMGPAAAALGVPNLLLPYAAFLAACAVCAYYLGQVRQRRSAPGGHSPAREARAGSLVDDLRAIRSSGLLRAIGLLTILQALLINLGGYQFYLALQARFAGDDQAIVAFFGVFTVATGLLALGVQSGLTGTIMGRFGAVAATGLYPVAAALAAIAGLATGGALWAMAATRGTDPVFRRTINEVGI